MTTNELIQQISAELVSRDNAIAAAIAERDAANASIVQLQSAIDSAQTTVVTPEIVPVIALSGNFVNVTTPPSFGDTIQWEREIFDSDLGTWTGPVDSGWYSDGQYHPGGRIRIRGVQTEGSLYGAWSNWLEAP